jgi:23S rRNA pseudoU1915 N3-methylase RlmH
MTKEEQKILNDSLSKLFKIEPETLASLYNEAGELSDFSEILKLDAARILKFKSENDSQYKRGIKEGAEKIESALREKYELDSELKGVDLVDHLVVKKIEDAKAAGTKDITKHPDYIKLQVSVEKQLKDRDKEWEVKLTEKEKEIIKAKLLEKVDKRALTNLESRKPILSEDPRKAQKWKDTYLNELHQGNYMEDGDTIIVLDREGKPLQTDHGKPVSFDDYEKEIADQFFEYPKSEQRSSPGNKTDPKPVNNNGFIAPKSKDEYFARLRDPKVTAPERIQLTEFANQNFK